MKTNEVKEIMGIEFTKHVEMSGHVVVWRAGLAYSIDRMASIAHWCGGLRRLNRETGWYPDCKPIDVVNILRICDAYKELLNKQGYIPVAL